MFANLISPRPLKHFFHAFVTLVVAKFVSRVSSHWSCHRTQFSVSQSLMRWFLFLCTYAWKCRRIPATLLSRALIFSPSLTALFTVCHSFGIAPHALRADDSLTFYFYAFRIEKVIRRVEMQIKLKTSNWKLRITMFPPHWNVPIFARMHILRDSSQFAVTLFMVRYIYMMHCARFSVIFTSAIYGFSLRFQLHWESLVNFRLQSISMALCTQMNCIISCSEFRRKMNQLVANKAGLHQPEIIISARNRHRKNT